MPEKTQNFYLVEETIERIREIEQNLELNRLDVTKDLDLSNKRTLAKINNLIANLEVLASQLDIDPKLIRIVTQVTGLRDFLKALKAAGAKGKALQKDINKKIDFIAARLDSWTKIAQQRIYSHLRGKFRNEYLKNLPRAPSPKQFYVFVKELNPVQTRYRHPIDERQARRQAERKTQELLKYDPEEPISGYRFWEKGDRQKLPGSGIKITNGHHRVYEIYRRYLQGKLDGNMPVLIKIDYVL